MSEADLAAIESAMREWFPSGTAGCVSWDGAHPAGPLLPARMDDLAAYLVLAVRHRAALLEEVLRLRREAAERGPA